MHRHLCESSPLDVTSRATCNEVHFGTLTLRMPDPILESSQPTRSLDSSFLLRTRESQSLLPRRLPELILDRSLRQNRQCQDFLSYLTSKITPEVLAQHNLKLSIVGCGDWELIKPYRENLATPFDIYADPTKETYVALGMTLRTLDMGGKTPEYQKSGMIGNIFGSIVKAFKIGGIFGSVSLSLRLSKSRSTESESCITTSNFFRKNAGDQKQLGGEFVFASECPNQSLAFLHNGCEDIADLFNL